MLHDKDLAPSYRCQKKNSKRIDLERIAYNSFVTALTTAIAAALSFKPEDVRAPDTLRKTYVPVYDLLAVWAKDAFDRPTLSSSGMFNLSVDGMDLINGVVIVSFVYEEARVKTRYQLQIHNHLAPYTEVWPAWLGRTGGDPKPFLCRMALV
jgi:hypothetical protein